MGIVYMLGYENLYYIGSTVQTLKERIRKHKSNYKCWLNKTPKSYCSSFEIIKFEGYEVIEIEEVIGETEEECRFREQWWIEFYGRENLLNKVNANGWDKERTKKTQKKYGEKHSEEIKEWRETNKEKINKKRKEWRENNKEQIKIYNKEYYKEYQEINKEKLKTQRKEYCETNKEQQKIYQKEYRENNKQQIKEYRETHKEQTKQRNKEYYQKQKLLLNSNNLNITTTD